MKSFFFGIFLAYIFGLFAFVKANQQEQQGGNQWWGPGFGGGWGGGFGGWGGCGNWGGCGGWGSPFIGGYYRRWGW